MLERFSVINSLNPRDPLIPVPMVLNNVKIENELERMCVCVCCLKSISSGNDILQGSRRAEHVHVHTQ